MVATRRLVEMESLPVDRKEFLWEMAKELSQERLTKKDLIEFCKCLYVFDYFLTNQI